MAAGRWSGSAWLLFAVVVVAWGFNYLVVKVGLGYATPLWLATLRASVGAVAVLAVVSLQGNWGRLDGRGRRDALLLGVPNTALFFGLWFTAEEAVLPGLAAVVVYTFPLWVAVLSGPVLRHRVGARHWVSVAVGFLGIALVSQIGEVGSGALPLVPVAELLLAAVAWAVGTVLMQRRFHRDELPEANAYQLLGGSAALIVATAALALYPTPRFSPVLGATVLWTGVLGTAVAYSIWFYLLGRTRAATLSAYVFLVPVVALLGSAIFFSERLTALQWVGVAFVFGGIYGIGRAPGALEEPAG